MWVKLIKTVKGQDLINGDKADVQYEEVTTCPRCRCYLSPTYLNAIIYTDDPIHFSDSDILYAPNIFVTVLNFCTGCNQPFLTSYEAKEYNSPSIYICGSTLQSEPIGISKESFNQDIKNISPSFIEIYNQAKAAEDYRLVDISGMAYRKALEFLIKDYASKMFPDKENAIKQQPLTYCIKNYIKHEGLQAVAEKAAWLGNDQTHYYQKFRDKDVSDLKEMIDLTVHWISLIMGTERAKSIKNK